MATFDRFDICEAHLVLEWDYNVNGWVKARPSNRRRWESTGVQLRRIGFKPAYNLSFETLTDNGKEIYTDLERAYFGRVSDESAAWLAGEGA